MDRKKLNVGCGKDYRDGWINLDYDGKCDVKHDLNKFPYPFEDNYFDYILCSHTLEHVLEPLKVAKELHRILKRKGEIVFLLPVGDFTIDHFRGIHTKDYFYALVRNDGAGNDSRKSFELIHQKRRLKKPIRLYFRFRNWFLNLFTDEWEYKLKKI